MAVLTKKDLMELNITMLGKGAPVDIDGVGYNKPDFMSMEYLAYKSELTDYEAGKIAKALIKYTNTQLSSYKTDIVETAKFFEVEEKMVKVAGFDSETISLGWNFNRNISDFIKYQADKSMVRWMKQDNGTWLLKVEWSYIDTLVAQFVAEGFDTSRIEEARKQSKLPENKVVKVDKPAAEFTVARPENSIDTLVVTTPYDKAVVDAFHKVPYSFFNKGQNTWEFYIEYSAKLYEALSGLNVDLSQLKPWADIVKGWETSYNMIDLNTCPLKFKPYDFQIEDIQKLLDLRVGLNANDMGCGKTFQSVVIGESISNEKKLVICPPTLRINWKKEILHVNPSANVNIIYSADDFKVVDGWNIIGYSSLDKFLKELEAEQFQVIFIDEAHYIQAVSNAGTPESNRAFAVLRLAATANYVFPMTGTPKTNRNKNLFNILRVIRHPLTRGKWAFSNYGKTYCDGQNNGWGWDYNGNSNDEELNQELVPFMVRHLKKEVLPNLKKQRIITPVEVDLREYRYEISEYLNNRTNKNAEDLARLMRARRVLAIQKTGESIDFAKNLIAEDKKVVIVTCFTDVVKAVEKAFKSNCVKLVGGMSDEAKDKAITEFQTGKPQVMVMNIVAGGVGVTLTKAYNMIINDFDWTPGNLTQAEDRICRGGQVEEYCNIYYLYADGADMDEVFADTLTDKFATINDVVDGGSGDAIDYIDLINKSLEKSTGVKKVRRMADVDTTAEQPTVSASVKVNQTTTDSSVDFKAMSLEELKKMADEVGAICKEYDNPSIYRMRLVMAIKKQVG